MSQSLLRAQTKLWVNKEKGEKRKSWVLSQKLQPNQPGFTQGLWTILWSAFSEVMYFWPCRKKGGHMFSSLLFFATAFVTGNVVRGGKETRVAGNHNSLTSSDGAGILRAALKCSASSSLSSSTGAGVYWWDVGGDLIIFILPEPFCLWKKRF